MDKEIDQGSYGSLGASLAHSLIETGFIQLERVFVCQKHYRSPNKLGPLVVENGPLEKL
tara:strand:+ start:407 stop:583 length:177 start_codon:yes stop_codon:yes gene_type:complete